MARHALSWSTHEQHLAGDRWICVEETRTVGGGSIGVRIEITDLKRREASFRLLSEENPLGEETIPRNSVSDISTIDGHPSFRVPSTIVPPTLGLGGVCPSPISSNEPAAPRPARHRARPAVRGEARRTLSGLPAAAAPGRPHHWIRGARPLAAPGPRGVPPGEFIPIAERSGSIAQIDD